MDISAAKMMTVERDHRGLQIKLKLMQEALSVQDDFITQVESRLSPLLRPGDSPATGPGDVQMSNDSEIVEQLGNYIDRIGRHSRRLSELLDRLDV